MNTIQLIGSFEVGLIYALVAVGVYLSFRTLQFPDLTVDGSFPLGAAVSAALITSGYHPIIATLAAVVSGACAGFITAWMSTRLRMLNLLAGILTMTALYSINLRVMGGRPNLALLGNDTLFTVFKIPGGDFVVILLMTCLFSWLTYRLLITQIGLGVRATGSNPKMARAQGINDQHMIWLGLSVSNALVALAGSIFAQKHGFADVTMGVGTIIFGLAAVIIAEAILPTRTVFQAILACIMGAIIYRCVIALALNVGGFGLQASDLNLITALLMAFAMLLPQLKHNLKKVSTLSKEPTP